MPTKGIDFPIPDTSVPEFLWQRCQKRKDRVALVDRGSGRSFTFGEVYEKSRNCAVFLHRKGMGIGDHVGLCAPNSPEYVIAMLGIMGCGATVAPCNPFYKEGEIRQQFSISQPKIVILDAAKAEEINNLKAQLPWIKAIFVIGKRKNFTTLEHIIESGDDMDFSSKININPSEDIAIFPHSSGTTGLPKCVMLTHRNLIATVTIFAEHSKKWTEESTNVFYINRPMYHISGIFSILTTIMTGMKAIIDGNSEVKKLLQAIEKYKVTHFVAAPPTLIELANGEELKQCDTSSLVDIVFGAAPVAPDIWRRLVEEFNLPLSQSFGCTEALVISYGHYERDGASSCGTICPAMEVKIINLVTSEECSAYQDGEIRARGPQVMKGYLKNAEETAKSIDEEGWLHTGDIGHFDKKGRLCIVGRLKEMIKYKGFQVAPAELESVILKHSKVADVGVIGIPDPVAGELPKAFVVKRVDSLTGKEIELFVQSELVDYKQLTGGVEFVDAIPKSRTGKIDRQKLKKLAQVPND